MLIKVHKNTCDTAKITPGEIAEMAEIVLKRNSAAVVKAGRASY